MLNYPIAPILLPCTLYPPVPPSALAAIITTAGPPHNDGNCFAEGKRGDISVDGTGEGFLVVCCTAGVIAHARLNDESTCGLPPARCNGAMTQRHNHAGLSTPRGQRLCLVDGGHTGDFRELRQNRAGVKPIVARSGETAAPAASVHSVAANFVETSCGPPPRNKNCPIVRRAVRGADHPQPRLPCIFDPEEDAPWPVSGCIVGQTCRP